MILNRAALLRMSQVELDQLYSQHGAGPVPLGEGRGTPIVFPGSPYSDAIAQIVNLIAWQGKIFDPDGGHLRNRVLPFGIETVVAKIYRGDSWLDGRECIVLDYSETSILAQRIRDEIRMVAPGVYLGKVYWQKWRLIDFVLEF